jgi:hypothetical protein
MRMQAHRPMLTALCLRPCRHHWYPRATQLREEFEVNRDVVSARDGTASLKGGGTHAGHAMALRALTMPSMMLRQTDRTEQFKLVEHGENLLSRFRHWEPILREWLKGAQS